MSPTAPTATLASPAEAPADRACARLTGAAVVLGVLALSTSLFAVLRMLEAWRLVASPQTHRFAVLGLAFSYPAANVGAIIVLVLAGAGLAVVLAALAAALGEARGALRLARRLARVATPSPGGAFLIADDVPRAFCAGLMRPRVYVSTAALERLDPDALAALLAHERHHARRRDPLRLAATRVLARALYRLGPVDELARRHAELVELGADESAILAGEGDRSALARAMLAFDGHGAVDAVRVDHLLGRAVALALPAAVLASATALLALVVAAAALAGRAASGRASLALPVLSRQPCVLVLAVLAAGALTGGWRWRSRRRGTR